MKKLRHLNIVTLTLILVISSFSVTQVFADDDLTPPPIEEEVITSLEPKAELPEEVEEPLDKGLIQLEVESEDTEVEIVTEEDSATPEQQPVMMKSLMSPQGVGITDIPEETPEIGSNPSCEINFNDSKFTYKKPSIYYDVEDLTYKVNNEDAGWYVGTEKINYYYITVTNTGDTPLALGGSISQTSQNSSVQFYIDDVKDLEVRILDIDESAQIKVSVEGDYEDGCDLSAHITLKIKAPEPEVKKNVKQFTVVDMTTPCIISGTLEFEDGMTWLEWSQSTNLYNKPHNWIEQLEATELEDKIYIIGTSNHSATINYTEYDDDTEVSGNDLIEADRTYYWR